MKKFILSDELKIRKESFGGVLLIKKRKAVRFYNDFGYVVLFLLRSPITVPEIYSQITKDYQISCEANDIQSFIDDLITKDICIETTNEEVSKAEFFYSDVNDFPEEYFFSPLGVEIEYTNKCARQCDYCSYYSNPFVDVNKEMTLEQWKLVIDDVVESGVYYVRFTGGDPFMRKDILEAVKYADEKGLMVSVGSDLTVCKESDYEELAKLKNFVFLQTTLDGATEESCNRYRGKGNFKKVLKGMELMQKHNVPFIVGTVLTRHNVEEIGEIGRIVSSYGAMGYCFSPLYIAGRGIGMEDDLPSNEELQRANQLFKEIIDEGIIKPADSAWDEIVKEADKEGFNNMLNDQSHLTRTGERLVRIDPKGHVYVSVKLKRALVESNKEWHGGNIKKHTLLEIWQDSEDFKKWRGINQIENTFGKTIDTRELLDINN